MTMLTKYWASELYDPEAHKLRMPVPGDEVYLAADVEEVLDKGKLWSFLRTVLSQGGDIQLDYNAGKYHSYEEYSARLDGAARERADQFLARLEGE